MGILENELASASLALLHAGTGFLFTAKHVIDVDEPPRFYLIKKYGKTLELDDPEWNPRIPPFSPLHPSGGGSVETVSAPP